MKRSVVKHRFRGFVSHAAAEKYAADSDSPNQSNDESDVKAGKGKLESNTILGRAPSLGLTRKSTMAQVAFQMSNLNDDGQGSRDASVEGSKVDTKRARMKRNKSLNPNWTPPTAYVPGVITPPVQNVGPRAPSLFLNSRMRFDLFILSYFFNLIPASSFFARYFMSCACIFFRTIGGNACLCGRAP